MKTEVVRQAMNQYLSGNSKKVNIVRTPFKAFIATVAMIAFFILPYSAKADLGTYQSYTPSYTNITLGSGSTTAFKYTQIGKQIHVEFGFILGTSPSVTGEIKFSLPQTANSSNSAWTSGTATLYDSSAGKVFTGYVIIIDSTTAALRVYQNNTGTEITGNTVNATVPYTWASGDVATGNFTYETTATTNYIASSGSYPLDEDTFWKLENQKQAFNVFQLSFGTVLFGSWFFYHKARYSK